MSLAGLLVLAAVSLVAAAIGAITGGNSLLTVPAMLLAGMDPKTAVATNMLTVTFLSAGAAARFVRERMIPPHPTAGLVMSAVPGSIAGAVIALAVREATLRTIISIAMLGMAVFIAAQPRFGAQRRPTSDTLRGVGYVLMALWAIYGGMFSGGYTTVLTFACVMLFGTTLVEAVGLTKMVNFVGSAAATLWFLVQGRIDWPVGLAMSAGGLVGGWLGAHFAIRAGVEWVRRVFVAMVAALGVKLLFDVLSR